EILAAVPAPPGARVEHAAGPAISWHTDPDLARPSPRPLQSFNEIVLAAPYQLQATLGVEASADSYSGRIGDDNWIYEVGSSQHRAWVGWSFQADANVVHIRVEGTIHTLSIYAYALAIFGYASAEIILNLKVLDGTRLVGSSRLSVLRVISVVAWMSAVYAS